MRFANNTFIGMLWAFAVLISAIILGYFFVFGFVFLLIIRKINTFDDFNDLVYFKVVHYHYDFTHKQPITEVLSSWKQDGF
jgi:hypothetical protein